MLKVATFNIRYDSEEDKVVGPWNERRSIVAKMIQHLDAAVIGTQEGLPHQIKQLADSLGPKYGHHGVGRERDGNGEMCAIFYRKDIVSDPLFSGTFWLSDQPETEGSRSWGAACTRIATWCVFLHSSTQRRFFFLSCHLDHMSEAARSGACQLIHTRCEDLSRFFQCSSRVIVVGDFNCGPHSAPHSLLTSAGFRDAWLETNQGQGNGHGTFHAWQGTFYPLSDALRIDWITLKGNELKCKSVNIEKSKLKAKYWPSDHFPVVAEIELL